MALRELLARFGFEVDTKPLDKAKAATDKAAFSFQELGSTLVGSALIGGALHFTQSLIELGSELDDQSNRLGIGAEELQAWRFAAGQGGASAEEMGAALKILTKNIAEAADNGAPAKDFAALGVNVKDATGKVRDATEVVGDIAEKMAKAETQTERAGIALKFFGKGGLALLPMLKDGRKGIQELFDRFKELGGGYSKEFVSAADAAGDAQAELGIAFASLKSKIGVQVLPIVTALVNKITNLVIWIRKATAHSNVFRVLMGAVGAASVLTGVKLAAGLASKFGLITSAAGGASSGILGTVSAFGKLTKAGAGVGLKILLLFLILEDLYTLFTGGHSAIGALIDGFLGVGSAAYTVEQVKFAFAELVEIIKTAWPALQWLGKQTALFLKDMFSGFKGYGKMFSEFFEFLGKDITNLWHNVVAGIMGKISELGGALSGFVKDHPILSTLTGGRFADAVLRGNAEGLTYGIAKVTGVEGAGRISQTNTTEINVNGAGDPAAVAGRIAAAQGGQNQQNQNALGALARP